MRPQPPVFVVRGADVVDGTGSPRFAADVVCRGDRIEAVTPPGKGVGDEYVAGDGLVVCPGFIDSHTHDDLLVLQTELPNPKLLQGVCTVVTGNCGVSLAPMKHREAPPPMDLFGRDTQLFDTFGAYLEALDAITPAVNVVPLVGHTSLRVVHVADLGRPAEAREIASMRLALAEALALGAFGLSTGVYYPPARAADEGELTGVASALAPAQAMLTMHIRDEGDAVEAAVQEALTVGKACSARLVLSHHKAVGPSNHGRTRQTLAAVDAAAESQSVCLDCYPYEASSTMLDPAKAARIERVLITRSQPHPELAGRMLADIAQGWHVGLEQAARRLLPAGAVYFGMSAEDVDRVLSHPLCMLGSDGIPHDAWPHPRLWGTFPRFIGLYSRKRGLLPLEAAVHKMTGLTAQRFGLADRGRIAPGYAADLVMFDPATIADVASYDEPTRPPAGIEMVVVNGRVSVRSGQLTGARGGRRLLRA